MQLVPPDHNSTRLASIVGNGLLVLTFVLIMVFVLCAIGAAAEPTTAQGHLERAEERLIAAAELIAGAQQDNQAARELLVKPTPAPQPDPAPQPEPEPTPIRQPVGYYVMQEVGAQNVGDAKLKAPKFRGIVIRESWAKANPSKGQYNWSFVDAQIARAKKFDREVILSFYTGSNAPKWIPGPKFGPQNKPDKLAPYPWQPEMLAAYEEFIAAAGKRYNDNPLVVGVEIGGPTCPDRSIEMHFSHNVHTLPGYSEAKMIAAWNRCGDAVAKAFPNVAVISDGGPAPGGGKATITLAFWDYMHKTYGQRFNASHCALAGKTPEAALHHRIVVEHKQRGGRIGFEALCNQTKDSSKFGTGTTWAKDAFPLAQRAGASWIKVYQWDVDVLPEWK